MIVEPSDVDIQARRVRDRALVEAHCSGDPRAFATIVADHYRVLLAQADRRLGDRGAAEDAVQETFERAFRAVRRFGGNGEYRLGAWLSRILANVCADHGCRVRAERDLSERVAREVPEADLGETFSDPYILRAVRDAVAALPSSQRDTFLLKEMDGLSYPQIADRLEISQDNARARVHRARAALRQSLALTRAMFGAVIAVPIGMRTLFRKARGYVPPSRSAGGGTEAGSSSVAQTLAAHVAANPVVQSVVSIAPSGAFRGSVIAGLASLAVTGAIAIPAVTSGDHSRPSTPAESVVAVGSDPASTTLPPPSTASSTSDSTAPAAAATEAVIDGVSDTAKRATDAWWASYLAAPNGSTTAPASGATNDESPDFPDVCGPGALSAASAVRGVVSTLDFVPAAAENADGFLTFTTSSSLVPAVGGGELTARATACFAPDVSSGVLAVDLSDGTSTVRLVGTSRFGDGGVWIFRGHAEVDGDGELPWLVREEFLARLVLVTEGEQQTATLSFAFLDDEGSTAPQGTPGAIVVPPPTTTTPPTTTAPPATATPSTTTPVLGEEPTEGSGPPAGS